MAYEGPLSNRIRSNLVQIVEMALNFSTKEEEANSEPIILDATTDFSKEYSAQVSNNPIGDKTDKADHYRVDNPTISISGVISNDTIDTYTWATSLGGTARAQQYVERMEKIFLDKRLVEIRMPDGLNTSNCLITSLSISRDTSWSNGFRIELSAQQIQILTGEITKKASPEKKDVTSKTVNSGTKSPVEAKIKSGEGAVDIKLQENTTTVSPLKSAQAFITELPKSANLDILRSLYA